ncbi:MAG: family 20 glycosylhydrolase [Anaerolineae bacterium]|nr:family 20 glycosylhydrolase [Anaerolineae bacterium]
MTESIVFLPNPRHLTHLEGVFRLAPDSVVLLDAPCPQDILFSARRVQAALQEYLGLRWSLVAGRAAWTDVHPGLTLSLISDVVAQPQGYRLAIAPEGIQVYASDAAGIFYAVCTLIQLLQQAAGPELPCLDIRDWPDFPARGLMLDVSRDKVPTMETLFALVDRLASWKINQLQLYIEHTFAYHAHHVVWEHASPFTGEEILALDAYCRERFIELVPNQNSFGHLEPWLRHAPYSDLAETLDEFETPWNTRRKGPFGLAPENPGSIEFIRNLYDELLPYFTSRQINVGCDETIDLGQGASKAICEERGTGQVYLDFLMKIYRDVTRRGYKMQFWGDIITHYPDLVPQLPSDAIALEWGYEFDHPFDANGAQFAAAGVPFYVCPGTASWNSLVGRTDNALGNLLNAAENGLKHGAIGYLNTDWGDRGHWQYLPMSYLGFGAGAAYSWSLDANCALDVPQAIGRFAFDDPSGAMGRIAYDLGNVYQVPNVPRIHNSSILFHLLQGAVADEERFKSVTVEDFETTLERIDAILATLSDVQMHRPDADVVKREFASAGRLLRHACRRALQLLGQETHTAAMLADLEEAIAEHKALWLARNRPGGLEDSLARFEPLREAYT